MCLLFMQDLLIHIFLNFGINGEIMTSIGTEKLLVPKLGTANWNKYEKTNLKILENVSLKMVNKMRGERNKLMEIKCSVFACINVEWLYPQMEKVSKDCNVE